MLRIILQLKIRKHHLIVLYTCFHNNFRTFFYLTRQDKMRRNSKYETFIQQQNAEKIHQNEINTWFIKL